MFFVLAICLLLGSASAFNDSCRLTPSLGARSPLYTTSLKIDHDVFFSERDEVVTVAEDDVILFYCTGSRNYFTEILPTTKIVGLTCVYGDVGVDVATLQCQKAIEPHIRVQRRPCSGDSIDTTYFQLGYELPFGTMFKILEGCYDNVLQRTLYTHHLLEGGKLRSRYGSMSKSMDSELNVEERHIKSNSRFLDIYLELLRSLLDVNIDVSKVCIIEESYNNMKKKRTDDAFPYEELFANKLLFKLYQFIDAKRQEGNESLPKMAVVDFLEMVMKDMHAESIQNHTIPVQVEKSGGEERLGFDENGANFFYGDFCESIDKEEDSWEAGAVDAAERSAPEEFYVNDILETVFEEIYNEMENYNPEKERAIIVKDREHFGVDYHLLSPTLDFPFGQQRRGVRHYLNNVPIFSSIAERNWRRMENRIRDLAISWNKTFKITTGVHDILQYPHKDEQFHDLYLGPKYTIPVPKYVYKLVVDPREKKGIVFVLYNSRMQFIMSDLCTNLCESGTNRDSSFELTDAPSGYIICCSPQQFWEKVPNAPKEDLPGGVLNMAIPNEAGYFIRDPYAN